MTIAQGIGSGKKEYVRLNSEARKALLSLRALHPGSEFVCPRKSY